MSSSLIFRPWPGILCFLVLSCHLAYHVGCSEVSNAPKIVDPVERLNHPEGTNATFTCSIGSGDLNNLVYEWKKDDVVLNSGTSSKNIRIMTAPDNFQSVLRVFDLKPSDAGVYSCLAENKHGRDRVYTRLGVKVQLKWLVQPRDIEISAGKPLHLPCQADGVPKPSIEWRKLDSPGAEPLGPELRFTSVRPEDGGHYECRARNGAEKDLATRVEVRVLGKYFKQSDR